MKKTILSIIVAFSALFLLILAYLSCGGGNTPPAPVPLTSLTLNRNTMTLAKESETGTLFPAFSPHNATNKGVTWSSSDTSIATVSGGTVKGVAVGSATIKATSQDGGKIAECLVEVVAAPIPAIGAYLSKNELYITEGGFGSLALNFIPSTATNQNVKWKSDNSAVAVVDEKTGFVTARGKGTANISAEILATIETPAIGAMYGSASDGQPPSPATRSAMLTVGARSDEAAVTRVDMDPKELYLSVDGTGILNPTVLPANANNANISFSSNAPDVASVSSIGLVTAKGPGRAVITVTTEDGGRTDVCIVNVTDAKVNPTGVSLNKTATELYDMGETERLIATVSPANATDKSLYWYSSDESIVSVDMNGTVQARGEGTAVVIAETQVGGKRSAPCSVKVTITGSSVPVTGVTLNKTTATLSIGGTDILTATVQPSSATNKKVTWSSSDTTKATVSDGTVTGVAAGSATITATTVDGKKTATCVVTVTNTVAVTGVTLNKTTASIAVGETETLTPTIAPENATNKKVTWASSNEAIATVDANGKVTGVAAGSANITVTTEDSSKTATCAVTVSGASVTGVTLNKGTTSIAVGAKETLVAAVAPTNATNKKVTWTSSNEAIATVDANGEVTGKAVGSATITVTTEDGNKTATCNVTVMPPVSVASVTLDKTSANILVGNTETLTATIAPPEATNKAITWTSSATGVATVSGSGLTATVTAVAAGSATITATSQADTNKTATCTVTVTSTGVAVTGVTLDPTTAVISIAGTIQLTHTITPSNATNTNVTWETNNPSVATVSNGTVTGVAEGKANITVKTQDGNKVATCEVTVQAGNISVGSVSLDEPSITIVGGLKTITIPVKGTKTLKATVEPANATNKAVTWKSSNDNIAKVNNGTVTAGETAGTATIIVATQDGSKTDTCVVNVTTLVNSVSLNKASTTILVGNTETLTETVLPDNAANKSVTWKSSNENVATVSAGGLVTGVAAGSATITATAQDGSGKTGTCAVTVTSTPIQVTGVTLDKTSIPNLQLNATQTLTATVKPDNATDKGVTWISSNTSVATITGTGLTVTVTGIAPGSTDIIVITDDGAKTATCTVTVPPVTSVTLNKTTASIAVGETQTLTATVAPSNAANRDVTWSSSDTTKATVSATGLVTGVAAGPATITVTTADGGKTATCDVTVVVPVTTISLKASTTVTVGGTGGTETLTPIFTPSNATNKNVTWSSSSSSVATVSTTGLVTGVKAGTATITVKTQDGNKTATCDVTVATTEKSVTGVSLSPKTHTISGTNTVTPKLTFTPSDAFNKNVTWNSSNTGVATVNTAGLVTGVTVGTATITVTAADTANGTITDTCIVTVNNVPVTGVSLNKSSTNILVGVGNAETLTATIAPTNANNKNVTWSSSNTDVATVSAAGLVTGVAGGSAAIIAKTVDGAKTATCSVTVTVPVTGVTLPATAAVSVGGTTTLAATVLPNTPPAANQNVTWSSDKTSVATVSSSGVVTGVAAGTAIITATSQHDSTQKATCTVTVTSDTVTGVTLSDHSATINVGSTKVLTATVAPTTANQNVTWLSSNTAVATVNNGTVTGVAGGNTTIFVFSQDGTRTDKCDVTVTVPVTGVTLPATASVSVGGTMPLTATVAPPNATNKGVTWDTSDATIATVTNGLVTGVKAGTVTITAETVDGGKIAECRVTVNNVPVTGVTLDITSITMDTATKTLTATVAPSNATEKKVIWTSSNPAVATVSNDGTETASLTATVTRVGAGVAIITVKTVDGSKTATCTVTVT
jgi:uncharacterized protein YjdB